MTDKGLIIFDLDDTLVDTSDVYWRARSQFVNEMTFYGFESDDVTTEFEHIDTENISIYGFSAGRYAITMEATCYRLLARKSLVPSEELLGRIRLCGKVITQELPQLMQGAKKLLEWTSQHYRLVLVTRGEEELQLRKLAHWGIMSYFERIWVVDQKDAETFQRVIASARCQPECCWVIGDSIKSDINPGIEAGANCILVVYTHHSYSWLQEHDMEPIGDYYKARSLAEVKERLLSPQALPSFKCDIHTVASPLKQKDKR